MNLFQMLWLLNVAAVCGWNEQVIRDLQTRQFIAETQMPPPVGLQDWDWAQRECFLPLPTQAPELLIFRSIVPTRNIPSFLRLSIPGDAVASDVVRRIDRTWDDIVHTDGVHVHWALNMVDRSVGRSMRIPRNIKAFILVTHAEHGRLLRHEAVVLLEVVCEVPNTQGGWAFTEARHMSRRQNRANLIFEIGFARACSQTHRCRVLHNGEYVRNRDVYLNVADFIVLLMRSIYALDPPLIEPSWDPSDSDNEPIFSHSALDPPAAEPSGQSVFGEAADEVEMETGSATTESSISSVTTATSSTRFLVVLHRPRLGHVPSQVHAFASTIDQRTVYAEARATWRDLQTDPFSLLKVHDSFEDDFSWDPNHLCLLVINEREFLNFPHLRAVMVHLRVQTFRDTAAIALPRLASEYSILSWMHMLDSCRYSATHHCFVLHNGVPIFGTQAVQLLHSDYLRVEAYAKESAFRNAAFLRLPEGLDQLGGARGIWPVIPSQPAPASRASTTSTVQMFPTDLQQTYRLVLTHFLFLTVPTIVLMILMAQHHTLSKFERRPTRQQLS